MASSVFRFAGIIRDQVYYSVYGHELNATSDNLKWALQQAPGDVLKYRFKDGFKTYTILEFAVKCDDIPATQALFELGADPEDSPASTLGSIVHFYMDCLREDADPNLEMLNLLLEKISDVNVSEAALGYTPLERALKVMGSFNKIHWDVIETLLQKGGRITEEFWGITPFKVLVDSSDHKITRGLDLSEHRIIRGDMSRSFDEEKLFFRHLVDYITLERKYHPTTDSHLSLDQFKFFAGNFRRLFSRSAISMSCSSSLFGSTGSLLTVIKTSEGEHSRGGNYEYIQNIISKGQAVATHEQSAMLNALYSNFSEYRRYFELLVGKGCLLDCFEPWVLSSIEHALEKTDPYSAEEFRRVMSIIRSQTNLTEIN